MTNSSRVAFQSFEKDILSKKIVDSLLTLIKEKKLLPGNKLPPERELAEMMNVGRPALREALRALSIMNVIDIRPGSGAYVSTLQTEQLVEHLEFVFDLDESSIFQLFDARKTLELRTVALAAQHITEEELVELEKCLAEMTTVTENKRREELDHHFHKLIANASRNPILSRFVSVVNRLATESRRHSYRLPGEPERAMQAHQVIIEALKARDSQAAQEAMAQHLDHAEQNLQRLINE